MSPIRLIVLLVVVAAAAAGGTVFVLLPKTSPQPPASQSPPAQAAAAPPAAAAPANPQPANPQPANPQPANPQPAGTNAPQSAAQPPAQAATPAAPPTPPPLPAAPAAAPASAGSPPADVATVQFSSLVQPFTLVRDSAAFVAASLDAPQFYPLKAGTPVKSVEKSNDGKWVIAMTEDGQAAYLPAADLGPYDPTKSPAPDLPSSISGTAEVVDTATLTVDGQNVPLVGVHGLTGVYADQMQSMIGEQVLTCDLQGDAYRCSLPNGLDLGRTALFNGAATPTDDASEDYKRQADAAKSAHKGIWK